MSKQTKKGELIECVVLSPVNHDGESYAIGDSVSLTEAQAKELAAAEIVALPKAASV